MTDSDDFDVVVIGGGHAGCEAASAAARYGARTALVTMRPGLIGAMSCNPAIGGIGKGQLVREIDALDGLMGRVADAAGIQFRVLNRRKGAAVRGPRAQSDRRLYASAMQEAIRSQSNLHVIEGEAEDLELRSGEVCAVLLSVGRRLGCGAAVLTTGTFLRGLIHIGEKKIPAGRIGESAAHGLSRTLKAFGFQLGRLKTGTPPRLNGRTVDWASLEMQPGDETPTPFSLMTEQISNTQIECGITRTSVTTHEIVRQNISRSAMYSGSIKGVGPRYCPSIEDKIARFGDRTGHQIFLEPEGLEDDTVYPNGISNSFPEEVQTAIVHSIPGLERAQIKQFGYAIEYDFVNPTELSHNLETRKISRLFLAGQINGTTGYEEAAAQGVLAGVNAALRTANSEALVLSRSDAYLGVLVDDLVTRGVTEPYRMFTSRAEFRLSVRADNADERLTPIAEKLGICEELRRSRFSRFRLEKEHGRAILMQKTLTPNEAGRRGVDVSQDGVRRSLFDLLAAHDHQRLSPLFPEMRSISPPILDALQTEARYAVYLEREAAEAAALRRNEAIRLSPGLDFSTMPGLSNEVVQRLKRANPETFADARRLEGVTPAAQAILLAHLRQSA